MRSHLILSAVSLSAMALGAIMLTTMPASTQSGSDAEEEAETPYVLPKSGPFNPEEINIENDQAISDWYRSAHADQAAADPQDTPAATPEAQAAPKRARRARAKPAGEPAPGAPSAAQIR